MPVTVGPGTRPYQQAASVLRAEIKSGRFKPGEQLPAYRELQERFGIAGMTARSAVAVLRAEGLVHTVQGRGTFVRDPAVLSRLAPGLGQGTDLRDLVLDMVRQIEYLTRRVADLEGELRTAASTHGTEAAASGCCRCTQA